MCDGGHVSIGFQPVGERGESVSISVLQEGGRTIKFLEGGMLTLGGEYQLQVNTIHGNCEFSN